MGIYTALDLIEILPGTAPWARGISAIKGKHMINYATRLPPGKPVDLINDELVRKTHTCSSSNWLEFMEAILNHFIKYPDPMVVPVYSYEVLVREPSKCFYQYSYTMMRCGLLAKEERHLIDDIGNLRDKHGTETLSFLSHYPDIMLRAKESPKLFEFLIKVLEQGRYWDLHSGNIMMDTDHNYCLIDLESFVTCPLSRPENDWISR